MDANMVDRLNAATVAEIRAELAAQSRSMSSFSEDTGISRASLVRYLSGDRSLPVPTLYRMLNALQVTGPEFFARVGRRERALNTPVTIKTYSGITETAVCVVCDKPALSLWVESSYETTEDSDLFDKRVRTQTYKFTYVCEEHALSAAPDNSTNSVPAFDLAVHVGPSEFSGTRVER